MGTPVTWLELLSPTNKPGGTGQSSIGKSVLLLSRAGWRWLKLIICMKHHRLYPVYRPMKTTMTQLLHT
jgi:hypothetical protein